MISHEIKRLHLEGTRGTDIWYRAVRRCPVPEDFSCGGRRIVVSRGVREFIHSTFLSGHDVRKYVWLEHRQYLASITPLYSLMRNTIWQEAVWV